MGNETNLRQLLKDYRKKEVKNYSMDEASEVIRQAFVELNGGSSVLNVNSLGNRELFKIIGEYVDATVNDGLRNNDFFNTFCEQKNLAEGDGMQFNIKGDNNFIVSDIARGTTGLRRQRAINEKTITLNPTAHGVKVYEEASRLLSGRIDINELANTVSDAVVKAQLQDMFSKWDAIAQTALTSTYYPTAGTYSESTLMNIINHVESANASGVTLVTDLAGARSITTSVVTDQAKNDYYNNGYALKWNGVPVHVFPQAHKTGTTDFAFNSKKIFVIPTTMDRPIKQVIGGQSYVKTGELGDNADMSIDIEYITFWATAIVTGKKFGIYELS